VKKQSSQDEREALADFAARYAVGPAVVVDDIERRVIGDVWGANGFTTVAQADRLAHRLDLRAGKRLLDIGTGRGWPGLYLARLTGCEVVLTDLPIEGLTLAARRARRDHVSLLGAAVASARHPPFTKNSFDAIVHADVLC
jgi:2-polyprenyl-3-methyl-5-hydroxy-6-metoxy-1,4-benzoquinol methylase